MSSERTFEDQGRGGVYPVPFTNDDSEDDDTDHEYDDVDDDEDDALLSYLFNKEHTKQHLFAIFIAIVASVISYYHILSPHDTRHVRDPIPIQTEPTQRKVPLKATNIHHHHAYKRTDNLFFCPLNGAENGFASLSDGTDSHQKRIQTALALNGNYNHLNDISVDPNLQLFQFNFPKEYTDLAHDYFVADETMDDYYSQTLSDVYAEMTDHPQFQCLIDVSMNNQHKSTIPMNSIAYIQPNFASFYSGQIGQIQKITPSVRETRNSKDLIPASLTYTGFTAKFINLSTKPMNLFWDGREKPKFRSRIQPFEAFTTVTTPGNTFYIAPIYDKDHAMERWTMTADEAVVTYDSIVNDNEVLMSLTYEEKKLYEMQKLNLKYGQEYLAKTQRSWLSMFPRPMNMHFMWDANYFGQEHKVLSEQSHFVTMPSVKDGKGQKEIWRRLDYADYDTKREQGQEDVLNLKKYRKQEPLELTLKVLSVAPRVFEIDGFLSDVEVDHLLDMASIYNITKSNGEEKKKSTYRITNAWIKREMSPIVDAIYHRSADIMKIDESFLRHRNEYEQTEINTHHSIAETMHLTQYVESQGYMPRSDATQPPVRNRYQPHRFATVVFFLNDVVGESGGDTVFPLAVNEKNHDGIRVVPKRGKALLFYNMLPDGNVDDLSQHSSEFVQDGEKWLGTLFVWDPIIN